MTAKKKTTKTKKESAWAVLSKIDCSEHVEKKGRFSYLSWAWAWGILMEHYPNATFDNHLNFDGYPCFFDANGNAMVRVTLCIDEVCHCEDFPVLNHQNKSIKNPDSFAVNTALKRCLVKCMAYFGLGHYIYAGEDLPVSQEAAEEVKETKEVKDVVDFSPEAKNQIRESQELAIDAYIMFDEDGSRKKLIQNVLDHWKVKGLSECSNNQIEKLFARIQDDVSVVETSKKKPQKTNTKGV